jgi:DNA-binding response OmpR family regulator
MDADAVRLERERFRRALPGRLWGDRHTSGRKDIWPTGARVSILDGMRQGAILLADRELEHRRYLERQLREDGFTVFEAHRNGHALDLAERLSPDVVIADETELCRRLREGEPGRRWNRNVPVILLTDEGATVVDRVRALDCGADDVVERHLYLELLARMRALLRRSVAGQADVVEAGPVTVDRRARQVRVDGVPVRLSTREYELAVRLATEPWRVFTKAELLRDVWGIRTGTVRTRTVDSHASRLRRKLELAGADALVVNVWGVGYRFLP